MSDCNVMKLPIGTTFDTNGSNLVKHNMVDFGVVFKIDSFPSRLRGGYLYEIDFYDLSPTPSNNNHSASIMPNKKMSGQICIHFHPQNGYIGSNLDIFIGTTYSP